MRRFLILSIGLLLASSTTFSQERVRVGILPFDVANVDGGSRQAATAMAKLVRTQMITSKTFQPILLEIPDGTKLPMPEKELARLAGEQNVKIILAGTILEATTTHGSNRISTGSIGAKAGLGSVGGSMNKSHAAVLLNLEIVNNEGRTTSSFQVEGSNTDVGIGADLWTTLGSFDVGEGSWDKSPMGKALREAAQKITTELGKRIKGA
jgi:curli biogenesis system outer membrane secretion channel CsgG